MVDCRGRISPIEHPDRSRLSSWIAHRLKVNSVNGALLEALKNKHGGQFVQIGKLGEIVSIHGIRTRLKNNLFEWILGAEDTKRLLHWAKPKLPLANRVEPRI